MTPACSFLPYPAAPAGKRFLCHPGGGASSSSHPAPLKEGFIRVGRGAIRALFGVHSGNGISRTSRPCSSLSSGSRFVFTPRTWGQQAGVKATFPRGVRRDGGANEGLVRFAREGKGKANETSRASEAALRLFAVLPRRSQSGTLPNAPALNSVSRWRPVPHGIGPMVGSVFAYPLFRYPSELLHDPLKSHPTNFHSVPSRFVCCRRNRARRRGKRLDFASSSKKMDWGKAMPNYAL